MKELGAGQRLDSRFELVHPLGRGGVGEVWLANDLELNEQIALKVLRPELAGNDVWVGLLRDECRRVRKLMHPGIVRVYDFHRDGAHSFISMQYVPGESLKNFRGQDWQQVVRAVLPLTDALEYAHRQGLVHRDIKSSNVLFSRHEQPLLTDFGLAAVSDPENESVQFLKRGGSLPAMSPQQLSGAAPTVGDDIYGFGSMLYELIAGQPLFHPDVTEDKVLTETPPRLDALGLRTAPPPDLVGLVATMLQKNPLQRPQGIATVRAALESLVADQAAEEVAHTVVKARRRGQQTSVENSQVSPQSLKAKPQEESGGVSGKLIGAIAVLVAVLLIVVLWLPSYVAEREALEAVSKEAVEPTVINDPVPESSEEPRLSAEQMREARRAADQVLGEVLTQTDVLKALNVERWGANDWQQSQALVVQGDGFYKDRSFPAAVEAYSQALELMAMLETRSVLVRDEALQSGLRELEAGNQQPSIEHFELVLAIDPANSAALDGKRRAELLDELLVAMNAAAAAEADNDWKAAVNAYRNAISIDKDWKPAQEGLQRASAELSRQFYSERMGAGFSALAAKDYAGAKLAFEAALQKRPGDADALAALESVRVERQLAEIRSFAAKARIAEATENWPAAVNSYQAMLDLDAGLSDAQQGLARATMRAQLDQQLKQAIADKLRYNDQQRWDRANGLLASAREQQPAGPMLKQQVAELSEILRVAAMPVDVRFRSDGQTNVVIYKVGQLGIFTDKVLQLRPGVYTAVGNRDGYRDARINFTVNPAGSSAGEPLVVVLECKEPI